MTAPFLTSIAGSGTGQYFADQFGSPFMVRGDSMWGLITNAGYAGGATTYQTDIDLYMSTRASQGFNTVLLDCICTTNEGLSNVRANGNTWDGVAPFSGSIGTLNNSYWTRVDYAVSSAAANGITVLLALADSYSLFQAGTAMNGITLAQATTYGTNLASRYASASNIVWLFGNDYDTSLGYDSTYTNILSALRSGGDTHLVTIENRTEGDSRFSDQAGTSYAWGTSHAQINFVYTYDGAYPCINYAYTETSPLVVLLGDGWYDGTGFSTIPASSRDFMRGIVWWSLSSGSRGYMYGDQSIISWNTHTAFTTPPPFVTTDLGNIWNYLSGLHGWHQLVPDTSNVLVTGGRGTQLPLEPSNTAGSYTGQAADFGGGPNYYVTASRTPGGTLAVLYLPDATGSHNGGAVTIDQTKMATGYTATWVDPASAAQVPATAGSSYSRSVNNSQGGADWVLVLQAPGTPPAGSLMRSQSWTRLVGG